MDEVLWEEKDNLYLEYSYLFLWGLTAGPFRNEEDWCIWIATQWPVGVLEELRHIWGAILVSIVDIVDIYNQK